MMSKRWRVAIRTSAVAGSFVMPEPIYRVLTRALPEPQAPVDGLEHRTTRTC